ncbi:MAG: DUF6361 family protein [Gammaproteobacteria bacterium]
MASYFGWLDTSESDRRKALDVIDLFKQRGTVDELGIGSVRDTIADILSPGTSTIQTRARYFFFIPWIYFDIENSRTDRSKVAARARKAEIDLIQPLLNSSDSEGTIGVQAGASLRRIPSMIYWNGLGRLGFRLFSGSLDQYHRALRDGRISDRIFDAGEAEEGAGLTGNWNPHIPGKPTDFPGEASFSLTYSEAWFFREQLRIHAADTLFQQLVELGEDIPDIDYPWEHPQLFEFPAELQSWIRQAQYYAEIMHGAQLLYNLMLARELPNKDRVDEYEVRINEWKELASNHMPAYRSWDRPAFWRDLRRHNPHLFASVEQFSEEWIGHIISAESLNDISKDQKCQDMIRLRENRLKGNRARLRSRAHLEQWGGDSGSERLNYRWAITRTHAMDIIRGLRRHA